MDRQKLLRGCARLGICLVVGAGFLLSLLLDYGVVKLTDQVAPLNCLVPITSGLLVSLFVCLAVCWMKPVVQAIVASTVFVVATLIGFILLMYLGGLAW